MKYTNIVSTPASKSAGKSKVGSVLFPLLILIDDREQLPYEFDCYRANADRKHAEILVPTETRRLQTGDYTLEGHEERITIERKSKSDLFSTLSLGRKRFMDELDRMTEIPHAHVVVEAQWSEIFDNPPVFSQLTPKSVGRTVIAACQRYTNIHWHFMPDRSFAEAWTFRILERYMLDLPIEELDQ